MPVMVPSLNGKVFAITGGASGIGLAVVEHLLEYGARVSVADVQQDLLEKLEARAMDSKGEIMTTQVDVRLTQQVNEWIEATVKTFGLLDGAVNLAGVGGKQINVNTIDEIDDDDWTVVLDVNLSGIMRCLRAECKSMKEKGSVVNVSSTAGLLGLPKAGAYVAAKHGVIGLTKVAARDLGGKGIRVNCVAPGPVQTPILMPGAAEQVIDMLALKRIGQPTEVAALIVFLLSDASSFITGSVQVVDGGWIC